MSEQEKNTPEDAKDFSFEEKQPQNIIDINEAFKDRLHKTGEEQEILNKAGREIEYYNERKKEGKETFGEWSVNLVDPESREIEWIVGKNADGDLELLPNNAQTLEDEHYFRSDLEAEKALEEIKKKFPKEAGQYELSVMCSGLDDEQPFDGPKLVQ